MSAHKGRQQRHQICARCKHSVATHVHYDDWRSDAGSRLPLPGIPGPQVPADLAEGAFMTGDVWFALLLLALTYPLLAAVRVAGRGSCSGHRLHHHRVRHMRLRLHLRLHPAHGCASAFETVAAVGTARLVPRILAHPAVARLLVPADAPGEPFLLRRPRRIITARSA